MQETQDKVSHLTQIDLKLFEKAFFEFANTSSQDISFRNFRDIVSFYKKFNRSIVSSCLDKIIKRMTSQNEDEIFINFNDYSEYIEFIALEQHRFQNERDPEIKLLFDLLALGEDVIYKKKIVEVIKEFELPISIDEFFQPIGKKEEIYFQDFCYLFKSTSESGEIFMQTFASSFYNLNG